MVNLSKLSYCLLVGAAMLFAAGSSCQTEQQINFSRYYVNGKGLYEKRCQNCHHTDGTGLGLLIPPLTDSVFLAENKNRLACIIKYGLQDTIQIHNKVYNEPMPANTDLTNIEIAELIVYITNSFGNQLGDYPVDSVKKDLPDCK